MNVEHIDLLLLDGWLTNFATVDSMISLIIVDRRHNAFLFVLDMFAVGQRAPPVNRGMFPR
jgi:hypothetical protein